MMRILGFIRRLWSLCPACHGNGSVITRGRPLERSEVTDTEYADYLANGGWYFKPVKVECPRCKGSGLR